MSLLRLALRSIRADALGSALLALGALVAVVFSLSATLIVWSAGQSTQVALDSLGADLVVVPGGASGPAETALFTAQSREELMPPGSLRQIASIPGVATASPQLYLGSLPGATFCPGHEVHVIAYDPASDFTLQPWLAGPNGPSEGELVSGSCLPSDQVGKAASLYGQSVTIGARLEPTGTELDGAVFLPFSLAQSLAESAGGQELQVSPDAVSAVLVRIEPGADVHGVALLISHLVPGVVAIESPGLLKTLRGQVLGLSQSLVALTGVLWALAIVLTVTVFSLAASAHRRQHGVLRALGSTSAYLFCLLLTEASLLLLAGGALGVLIVLASSYLLRNAIEAALDGLLPLPPGQQLFLLAATVVLVNLMVISAAVALPAARASYAEPATAMRE